jgi:hypothetical protein
MDAERRTYFDLKIDPSRGHTRRATDPLLKLPA